MPCAACAPCLCTGRADVVCTDDACSIAGPGAPGDRNSCRVCWLRLGGKPESPPVPPTPGVVSRAGHFAGAVIRHATDGFAHVTEAQYQERLAVCQGCEKFDGRYCTVCGCPSAGDKVAKARWRSETCPHPNGSRWPLL